MTIKFRQFQISENNTQEPLRGSEQYSWRGSGLLFLCSVGLFVMGVVRVYHICSIVSTEHGLGYLFVQPTALHHWSIQVPLDGV